MHYIFQTIVFAYCDRHAMRDGNSWERLAIARDGTGAVFVLMSACGNGMGMDLFQRDGTGLVVIFIPVSLSTAQLTTQFSNSVDLFSPVCYRMVRSHVTVACSNWGTISRHVQVRRCSIKIDSAVNLGETPSSEFVQCLLRVIRLTKTVESICCAVRYTVTLPRAV